MRKLSLVIAGILGAGSPMISQAATLGEAQVQSHLSEPLEVRVPLMRSSDEPLDEITVQLAPPSFYREAGVPLASLTGNLTFAIETEGGQEYVRVGSKRPIRDPIVSLLLQVQSPQGRMIRSYNLLLDPPSVATAAPQPTQSSDRRETQRSATAAAASGGWQQVEPARDLELEGSRQVVRGDTLSEIARDYVGEGEDIRPVMQAIIDANPHAFANGNGNAMRAGVELKVPSKAPEAGSADAAPTDSAPSERLPALELLSPAEQTRDAPASPGGFGELTRDNPLPAIADSTAEPSQPLDAESALDEEELESVKAENEALTDQLRSLKEQIDSVKVAIDDRDATIAELRETVDQAREQAEEARSDQGNFWVEWGKYLTGAMGLLIIALLIALGLRRGRRDEEPGVPMPETADSGEETRATEPTFEREASRSGVAGAAAAGATAGAVVSASQDEERGQSADTTPEPTGSDDPMNPEMALEEARVLESFNLTHQAQELLQESLAEHPGHAGLQAAINRLGGIEGSAGEAQDAGPGQTTEPAGDEPTENEPESTATEDASADEPREERTVVAEGEPSAEEDKQAEAEQPDEIAWDDDFDDMLATPDTDAEQGANDNLMEFDDSFALETPTEEQTGGEQDEPLELPTEQDESLELPENEEPTASIEETDEVAAQQPDELDIESPGEPAATDESAAESAGAEPELEPTEAESPREASVDESTGEPSGEDSGTDADTDTRVSLAEAFLDVGDRESFDMIEAELREEGATAALERLEELKQRHQG